MRLHLFGGAEQVLERFFQHCRVHRPPAGVIAFGKLPQRVGSGEGEGHAGGRAADLAESLAGGLAEQPAQQLAAELFEVLRGEADPGGGDEFLDVALVEADPVGAADAVHHLDLQGDDGHRRPGLRQQFQGAIHQRVVEDGLVQFRFTHVRLRRHHRAWRSSYSNGAGHCRGRGGLAELDDGVGLALEGGGLPRIELQQGLKIVQEALLGRALAPVGIAHAHRHFIRQLTLAWVGQRSSGRLQADTLEQYVLVEPGQVGRHRFATQRFGDTANLLALVVVLGAVGKSGIQGDAKDGALLFRVHGHAPIIQCLKASASFSPASAWIVRAK